MDYIILYFKILYNDWLQKYMLQRNVSANLQNILNHFFFESLCVILI